MKIIEASAPYPAREESEPLCRFCDARLSIPRTSDLRIIDRRTAIPRSTTELKEPRNSGNFKCIILSHKIYASSDWPTAETLGFLGGIGDLAIDRHFSIQGQAIKHDKDTKCNAPRAHLIHQHQYIKSLPVYTYCTISIVLKALARPRLGAVLGKHTCAAWQRGLPAVDVSCSVAPSRCLH